MIEVQAFIVRLGSKRYLQLLRVMEISADFDCSVLRCANDLLLKKCAL